MSKAKQITSKLNVLVTRPEPKGRELAADLLTHGISAFAYPLFSYQLIDNHTPCKLLLSRNLPSILIFVSVAAVTYANEILKSSSWCYHQIFAVGQATQVALAKLGIKAIAPTQQDSEGLLLLEELQNVADTHIVIIRGDEGRELLFNTLKQRGAQVSYGQSYCRVWQNSQQDKNTMPWLFDINCVVITSVALLENMLDWIDFSTITNTKLKKHWQQECYWIVASERIAIRARQLGLSQIMNAQSANNQCLLETIIEMEQNND